MILCGMKSVFNSVYSRIRISISNDSVAFSSESNSMNHNASPVKSCMHTRHLRQMQRILCNFLQESPA